LRCAPQLSIAQRVKKKSSRFSVQHCGLLRAARSAGATGHVYIEARFVHRAVSWIFDN
jgi:hypothetical protein